MRGRIAELSMGAGSVTAAAPLPDPAPAPPAPVAASPEPPPRAVVRPAVARPGLAGMWTGRYDCGPSAAEMTLKVSEGEGDAVEAEVRFTVLSQSGTVPSQASGAYTARGRFNRETGDVSLAPIRWIERPPGVTALGLEGKLNGSGRAINGRMTGCMSVGQASFAVERTESSAAVAQATPAPTAPSNPTGGPLEGVWEGSLSCPRLGGAEGTLRLAVLQDGNGAAALATATMRSPGQPVASAQAVFLGAATDPAAPLRLQGALRVGNSVNAASGLIPKALTADRATGVISVDSSPSQCEARFRKVSPAPALALPNGPAFAGIWTGRDYHASGVNHAQAIEQARAGNLRDSTDTQLAIRWDGSGLYGEFQAVYPVNKPAAQQDRYAASVRPLFVAADGRVVLAPVDLRRAEGTFGVQSDGRPGGHRYSLEPFLLLLAPPQGQELTVGLATRQVGAGESSRIDMVRSDPAVAAAIMAGDGERLPLPPGYGGAFAAAPTQKAQCEVLAAWAKPFTSLPNVDRRPMGPELDREALPLFEDSTFEPVFGLSYPMTTGLQRAPLVRLMDACAARFGMTQLRHPNVQYPWFAEPAGSFRFAAVTALLMNRADAKAWIGPVSGEIAAITEDAAGLARLDALERTNRARIEELSEAERAPLRAALAAKRERIVQGISRAKMETALAAPDSPQLVTALTAAAQELRRSTLPPDERASMEQRVRDRAQAYFKPEVDRANARAPDLPATLDGLAEATSLLRRVRGSAQALGPQLGEAEAMSALQPLVARRHALVANPAVQDAFRQAMANLKPSGDPDASVAQAAAQFLDREELMLPRYAEAIAAAKELAEARSIEIVDSAPAAEPGEPSATEMAMAVARTYKNMSQNMRNPAGVWAPGPMQQLMTVFSAAMGPMSVRVAYFQKLGCVSAAAAGQPGYNCEMRVQLDTDNRQLAQALPRGVMEARGRFLRSQDGWAFRRQEN